MKNRSQDELIDLAVRRTAFASLYAFEKFFREEIALRSWTDTSKDQTFDLVIHREKTTIVSARSAIVEKMKQ